MKTKQVALLSLCILLVGTIGVANAAVTVTYYSFTRYNTSSSTGITLKSNITSSTNTTDVAYITLFLEDDSAANYTMSNSSTKAKSTNYTLNLTSTQITQDGDFLIEYHGNDTAGNAGTSSDNETGLATKNIAGQWNMITYSDTNMTTQALANTLPNVTYVSIYNNEYKNYTTYSTAAPTINNDTQLREGNATWIYTNADRWYLRKNYLSGDTANITLYLNYSDTTTEWNMMGLYQDKTMNQTLYAHNNISYVSWFNSTAGYYYTCKEGFTYCAGTSDNVTSITIPKSWSLWVLTQKELTLNRSAY